MQDPYKSDDNTSLPRRRTRRSSGAWQSVQPTMIQSPQIDVETLQEHFHLPITDVAKKLGVCATVLKKICRKNGISRWPHRKIKSLDKTIATLEATKVKTPQQQAKIMDDLEAARQAKDQLVRNPNAGAPTKSIKSRRRERVSYRHIEHASDDSSIGSAESGDTSVSDSHDVRASGATATRYGRQRRQTRSSTRSSVDESLRHSTLALDAFSVSDHARTTRSASVSHLSTRGGGGTAHAPAMSAQQAQQNLDLSASNSRVYGHHVQHRSYGGSASRSTSISSAASVTSTASTPKVPRLRSLSVTPLSAAPLPASSPSVPNALPPGVGTFAALGEMRGRAPAPTATPPLNPRMPGGPNHPLSRIPGHPPMQVPLTLPSFSNPAAPGHNPAFVPYFGYPTYQWVHAPPMPSPGAHPPPHAVDANHTPISRSPMPKGGSPAPTNAAANSANASQAPNAPMQAAMAPPNLQSGMPPGPSAQAVPPYYMPMMPNYLAYFNHMNAMGFPGGFQDPPRFATMPPGAGPYMASRAFGPPPNNATGEPLDLMKLAETASVDNEHSEKDIAALSSNSDSSDVSDGKSSDSASDTATKSRGEAFAESHENSFKLVSMDTSEQLENQKDVAGGEGHGSMEVDTKSEAVGGETIHSTAEEENPDSRLSSPSFSHLPLTNTHKFAHVMHGPNTMELSEIPTAMQSS